MKLIYFENYQEILQFNFPKDILVVCPSPKITDSFRQATKSQYEVETIASWVSKGSSGKKKVGKSELMLRFFSAWRNYFPQASEQLFYNAFELFTELRSFTLELNIIHNVIEDLNTDLQKSILIFWAVLDAEELVDEHFAYQLKKQEKIENQSLLLFGFKHLSAIQIDLIKHLATSIDVFLFFPKEVKSKTINTDWINWLDTTDIKLANTDDKLKVKTIIYSSGKLNSYLLKYFETESNASICLLGEGNYLDTQEAVTNKTFFKEKIDIFCTEFDQVFNQVKMQSFKLISELIGFCQEEILKAIELQNFKTIRILQLINESAVIFSSYSEKIDQAALGLIKQVTELNLPRNFLIPIVDQSDKQILNIDDLKFVNSKEKIIIIMSKKSSPFTRNENSYNSNVIDKLKVIGPLKRGSLDVALNMFEIKNFFKVGDAYLFLEEGMLETDAGMREISKSFEFDCLDFLPNFAQKVLIDVIKNDIQAKSFDKRKTNLSASRLQAFYDCPRKYYVNYLAKLDVRLETKSGIGADDKGVLEHLIIGKYFQAHSELKLELLEEFCKSELTSYSKSKQLLLSNKQFNETLFELIEFVSNGLNYLYNLKKDDPRAEIHFEYELPQNKFNIIGSIDCLIKTNNEVNIIDFKRSDAAIGPKYGLLAFDKLQLWLYGLALSDNLVVNKIGYLNISEIDSLLEVDFSGSKEKFTEKFIEIEAAFKKETLYLPTPRNSNVCEFCSLKFVCTKGVGHE